MLINEVILVETYVNLFLSDRAERERYKDEVWEILQQSYAPMGGIKGKGFSSPEEMVEKMAMWKLVRRQGRIVAVRLYKDKNGRKSVETVHQKAKLSWPRSCRTMCCKAAVTVKPAKTWFALLAKS